MSKLYFTFHSIRIFIILMIGLSIVSCTPEVITPTGLDFDEIIIPEDFDFETGGELNISITDPEDGVKYEVYTLSDTKVPNVVYTASDTIIEVRNTNQILSDGIILGGSWNETIMYPVHQDYIYLRRFKDGAYSGIPIEINGNSLEYHHSGSAFKSTNSEDVIYSINGSGYIGYFSVSDGVFHDILKVDIGSFACAIDKANNVLYYCQRGEPYYLMQMNLTTLETSEVGELLKNYSRMDYRAEEGLIYLSSGTKTYTYDPFSARYVASYKISNGEGAGDVCFGEEDYLYLTRSSLLKTFITGEKGTWEFIGSLPAKMNASCYGSDGFIYAVNQKDLYRVNPETAESELIFTLSRNSNDLGILLKDTQASNPDRDGDGVPNDSDQYPDNAEWAFNSWYPGKNAYGTLAFEDLWPNKGDYDFNDLVIDYKFNYVKNAQNEIVALNVKYLLRAIGGSKSNGFGFQLGLSPSSIVSVTSDLNLMNSGLDIDNKGLEIGQDLATIIVFADGFDHLKHPGGADGINTNVNNSYVEPTEISIQIIFDQGYTMGEIAFAPGNPFIFRTENREREIHLPGSKPTNLANRSLFRTGNDATNTDNNYYYKTKNGHPWAMNLPVSFSYPLEKVEITDAYLVFGQWAESGGYSFMDWYFDVEGYRDETRLYVRE
jgi:LruC domain-containing protein